MKFEPIHKDLDSLQKQIDVYFDRCEALEKPPSVGGLAVYLKIARGTFYFWLKDDKNPKKQHMAEMARQRVCAELESLVCHKKTFTPGQIFILTNIAPEYFTNKQTVENKGEEESIRIYLPRNNRDSKKKG